MCRGLFASGAAYGACGHNGDVQFEITRVDRPMRPHRTLRFEWHAYPDPGVVADAIVATYHELAKRVF